MYFCLKLYNPFKKSDFDNLYCKEERIPYTENKNWSFEILKENNLLFEFSFNICFRGQDHAGPEVQLGLFGYSILLRMYDQRHWNYDRNCWKPADEM